MLTWKTTVRALLIIVLSCTFCTSQIAMAAQVDHRLKEIYEWATGKEWPASPESRGLFKLTSTPQDYDVWIRLNGGADSTDVGQHGDGLSGINNKLYIGETNTVEILVANDQPLSAMSMAFQLSLDNGSYDWVNDYGNVNGLPDYTPGILFNHITEPSIIVVGNDLFDLGIIKIGWADVSTFGLPEHAYPALAFSFQIYVDEATQPSASGFSVNNVYIKNPELEWSFNVVGDDSTYVPCFQGNANSGPKNPDAPAVNFEVTQRECYSPSRTGNFIQLPDSLVTGGFKRRDFEKDPSIVRGSNGTMYVRALVDYEGGLAVLRQLGCVFPRFNPDKGSLPMKIPIDRLPEAASAAGVSRIRLESHKFEIDIDESSKMIDGDNATIKSNFGVEGNDVLDLVRAADSNLYVSDYPGYIVLKFPSGNHSAPVFTSNSISKEKNCEVNQNKMDHGVSVPEPVSPPLLVEMLDADGNWERVGTIPARVHSIQDAITLSDREVPGVITVRISWTSRYEADATQLIVPLSNSPEIASQTPQSVMFYRDGIESTGTSRLAENQLVLKKGQLAEFTFDAPASPGDGLERSYVVRASGRCEPVKSSSEVLPQGFVLHNYVPNPFNPSTDISYELPAACHVNISVYNVLGQRVATLVDADMPAGAHSVSWNATSDNGQDVASGVYLYRLVTDGFEASKKMLLLK